MNLPMKNETIINAKKGFTLNLKEFWLYRELLYFLAWRDLKVRYKQTVLGALWAVIQPFVTMFIFSIFFGRVAGIGSGDIPYPIFLDLFFQLFRWNQQLPAWQSKPYSKSIFSPPDSAFFNYNCLFG